MRETRPIQVRRTVAEAATWRVLAELMRRHAVALDLRILESHPGGGQYDCRSLWQGPDGRHLADFDLAAGSMHAFARGAPERRIELVALVLAAPDPKDLIDEIEVMLGLPRARGPLPADTPAVLCVRVIAALLARRVFGRAELRTENGMPLGDGQPDWAVPLTGARSLASAEPRALQRFWRVHTLGHPGVALDLAHARLFDLATGDAATLDVAAARREDPRAAVDWIDRRLPL